MTNNCSLEETNLTRVQGDVVGYSWDCTHINHWAPHNTLYTDAHLMYLHFVVTTYVGQNMLWNYMCHCVLGSVFLCLELIVSFVHLFPKFWKVIQFFWHCLSQFWIFQTNPVSGLIMSVNQSYQPINSKKQAVYPLSRFPVESNSKTGFTLKNYCFFNFHGFQ
jgi:hypothetical protein